MRRIADGARRGVVLPAVLAVLIALSLLSALALFEATQAQRVSGLVQDELVARASLMEGAVYPGSPGDLPELCLRPPLAPRTASRASAAGGQVTLRWRHLGRGLVRFEVEGAGAQGARVRAVAYLRADPLPDSLPVGCPIATRLIPAGTGWREGHPDG